MNEDIRAALEDVIYQWAKAQTPAVQVAFENVPFSPPAGLYLRTNLMPANTVDDAMAGGATVYGGVFQVSIVAAAGIGPVDSLIDTICALYPAKTRLSHGAASVLLATPMSARPPLQSTDRFVVPLDCRYRATRGD